MIKTQWEVNTQIRMISLKNRKALHNNNLMRNRKKPNLIRVSRKVQNI